ncbi:protocadherin-15 [Plakobranchus ocellatus]|uniref:Protocadherin-15 n=1 Tax=Plakobranchus ocellatus TaxID=259542 RepID=A0AAV4BS86_9GAST|nr:protocadherin-15 [Plakobranchus ocellatus]
MHPIQQDLACRQRCEVIKRLKHVISFPGVVRLLKARQTERRQPVSGKHLLLSHWGYTTWPYQTYTPQTLRHTVVADASRTWFYQVNESDSSESCSSIP